MADGITLSTNIGSGSVIKTDDDGTYHWQLVKVAFGGDNTQTEVTSSVGLPVSDAGGSLTVDNAGTFVVQIDGAALTALQKIDDSIYVDDGDWLALTSSHQLMGGIYQSSPGSITDGDTGPIRLDANGAIHINDGGNSITIDGTVTANLSATDNAVLDQIEVNTSYGDNTGGGTEANSLRVTLANDSTGLLSIDDNGGSLTVDNGGTFVVQEDGAALTALQVLDNTVIVDDAAFTPSTTSVNMAGFTFDDSTPDSVDEGDAGAARMSANRNIYTTLRDASGNERGANINASNQLEINIGAQTADITIADGGNSITVDNGGTFATQATLQANSGVDIGDVDVTSVIPGTGATNAGKAQDTAVGATDTGFALLLKRDDEQAAVTPIDGDYVVPTCDRFGKVKITELPDATSEVKYAIIDAASSGDNTLQAAAGAGIKIRVLSVMMISAGTVTARFESGASGTALSGQMNLVANSGFTLPYNPHGWFETADNALLNLELSAAISVDGMLTYVEV